MGQPSTAGTYNFSSRAWYRTTNVAVTVGARTSSIDPTDGFLATLAQIQNEIASISYAFNHLTVSK
jgi:hypothetical protein